jgi:N-acetylmuramoyl-L-alanine amidase
MFRKPKYIIMHDSLTEDGQTVSWGAIRKFHMEVRGWANIGYHFGIELINDDYEILMGRIIGMSGAHCPGRNSDSVGICLIGNFDETLVPERQWDIAVKLVAHLSKLMNIPKSNILGHREAMPGERTCPHKNFDCILFREDVDKYIKMNEWGGYY